jgi:hypothetical protein
VSPGCPGGIEPPGPAQPLAMAATSESNTAFARVSREAHVADRFATERVAFIGAGRIAQRRSVRRPEEAKAEKAGQVSRWKV